MALGFLDFVARFFAILNEFILVLFGEDNDFAGRLEFLGETLGQAAGPGDFLLGEDFPHQAAEFLVPEIFISVVEHEGPHGLDAHLTEIFQFVHIFVASMGDA